MSGAPGSEPGYTICFANDGFEELAAYHSKVDQLVGGLVDNEVGFVAMAPEMFSFVRVDLVSDTAEVNDESRTNTALGAYLRDDVLLCEVPVIGANQDAVALARKSCGSADAIVVVVNESDGRAQAEGSVVLMSSRDNWRVLQHELGHALFGLGDEYTEFEWCSQRAPYDPYDLLPVPNVGFDFDEKWQSIVDGSESGGGLWPCLTHPTSSCAMLDHAPGFCPVCRAHVQEALDGKRCLPDTHPPRLSFTDTYISNPAISEPLLKVAVAAHDETDLGAYRLLVDGQVVHESPFPELHVPMEGGAVEIEVQVEDAAGNIGTTGTRALQLSPRTASNPNIEVVSSTVDIHGRLQLVIDGASGLRVEAHIGEESFHARIETSPMIMILPTGPQGPRTATLVAIDNRDQRSKPMSVSFRPPTQVPGQPQIISAAIGGRALTLQVDRIVGEVDIEVEIESCSALEALQLRNRRGDIVSLGQLTQKSDCKFEGIVPFRATEAPTDYVLHVTDRWQGQSTIEISQIASLPSGICPEPEMLTSVGSLLSPLQFGVPDVVGASFSVRGPEVALSLLTPSPTASEVLAYPSITSGLDMEETTVQVTVAQPCNALIVASKTEFSVIIDTVAPTLEVQVFGREGTPMLLQVSDGGGIDRVEVLSYPDNDELVDDTEPFTLPIRPGRQRVRAIDSLGNATEEWIDMYAYPRGTRDHCAAEAL